MALNAMHVCLCRQQQAHHIAELSDRFVSVTQLI